VTTRTRRRLLLAVVALALTVPAESILLQALVSTTSAQDAEKWVSALSESELVEAGDRLRGHSYIYRRAILRKAKPDLRVRFWSQHIKDYISEHPALDTEQRNALATALSALTPDALADPSAEKRESMRLAAEQVSKTLGPDEAAYLLVWVGPKTTPFYGSLDPLGNRLATFFRNTFAANAQSAPDCDCLPEWGCYHYADYCSESATCTADGAWPMCGWWWSDSCDDLCVPEE
jgi:hypothetical protein